MSEFEWISSIDQDVDTMAAEMVRLQERVRALEREQETPDNAFWGQLIFDVFMVFAFIALVWRG